MGVKAWSDGLGADKQSRLNSGRWPVQKPLILRGLQLCAVGNWDFWELWKCQTAETPNMKSWNEVWSRDKCPDLDSFLETLLGYVKVAVWNSSNKLGRWACFEFGRKDEGRYLAQGWVDHKLLFREASGLCPICPSTHAGSLWCQKRRDLIPQFSGGQLAIPQPPTDNHNLNIRLINTHWKT